MARPTTSQAALQPPAALVLRKSPARLKLEALEKERERLLREIEKKKLNCESTEHTVRDAHDAIHARTEPLRAHLFALLREIHQLFDQLLDPKSPLSRGDRAALRRFYGHIAEGLPRPDAEDAAREERAPGSARNGAGGSAGFDADAGGFAGEAEHASAHKPGTQNTELLRSLYKKLASALHPDKARDASEAERLTSLMKEVTRAYASEDLSKLVELDRTWLAQTPPEDEDDFERQSTRLLAANGELRRQLRALTARLKQIKQSLPGIPWPRKGARASGADLAAGVIADMEREVKDIERLRDAVRDLKQGRIDVAEFLRGPRPSPEDPADPLSEVFDQLLEDLLERVHEPPRRRSGRRR